MQNLESLIELALHHHMVMAQKKQVPRSLEWAMFEADKLSCLIMPPMSLEASRGVPKARLAHGQNNDARWVVTWRVIPAALLQDVIGGVETKDSKRILMLLNGHMTQTASYS